MRPPPPPLPPTRIAPEEAVRIEHWCNTARWLEGRVEELERRLRRRTLVLGGALAVTILALAGALAVLAARQWDSELPLFLIMRP